MKESTYYCIAFRFWGVSFCGVFKTLERLTKEIKSLYGLFDTPSQIDTCSIRACSEDEARQKAVEYFNKYGWDIREAE